MVLGVYKVGWKKKSSIFVEVESIDGEASWKNILKTVVLESVEILTSLGSILLKFTENNNKSNSVFW